MSIKSVIDMSNYMKDFKVRASRKSVGSLVIKYKEVELWRCLEPTLKNITILVLGGDVDEGVKEPYTLACRDQWNDYYTYGTWKTLDEVIEWLENPKSLYY